MKKLNLNQEADLHELRQVQLYLLDWLDEKSNENNWIYWLDFGTLLGARRNGKFIPWDDDIDVTMSMSSYIDLVSNLDSDDHVHVQKPTSEKGYKENFVKLRYKHSKYIEHRETENEIYHQGIYLDIFPAYEYPYLPKLLLKCLIFLTYKSHHKSTTGKFSGVFQVFYSLIMVFWRVISVIPKRFFGQIPIDNWYRSITELSDTYPLGSIKFEDNFYPSPRLVENRLRDLYGENFIQPPAVDQRFTHAKAIYVDVTKLKQGKL